MVGDGYAFTMSELTNPEHGGDQLEPEDYVEEPVALTEEEEQALVEAEPVASPVGYSGQDFDVAGLVRRLGQEDILVPTFGHSDERIESAGFQRAFVWRRPQMDRFIESLLLGYPIPGIFLVRQTDRRYLVLDGQQRLITLRHFYDGLHEGKEFALRNVSDLLKGLTYKTLPEKERRLLDDTFIQATIVVTDGTGESLEAIYQIFERVNAGGTPLTPHEIRVALYAGPFIGFLERLNQNTAWRALYGKASPRLRDQELVLRILALYLAAPTYRRPLKSFLNDFTGKYRELETLAAEDLEARFATASTILETAVGREALRLQGYQLNAALTESIFVGLFRRLDQRSDVDVSKVGAAIGSMRSDDAFVNAVSRATADEESVRTRLEIASAHMAGV